MACNTSCMVNLSDLDEMRELGQNLDQCVRLLSALVSTVYSFYWHWIKIQASVFSGGYVK